MSTVRIDNSSKVLGGSAARLLEKVEPVTTAASMIPGAGMLAAVPAAIQAGTGIYQLLKGNQLAQQERPDYSIPQEMLDMLTDSQIQALRGLPAEQRDKYIQDIIRSQQNVLSQAGDLRSGLRGLATSQQQAQDAATNLLSMDAQAKISAEQRLQGVRGQMAGYKDKEWETDEMNPYLASMQSAEGMRGAGLQNIMGGVQAGGQMGLDYIKYMNLLNSFGGKTTA